VVLVARFGCFVHKIALYLSTKVSKTDLSKKRDQQESVAESSRRQVGQVHVPEGTQQGLLKPTRRSKEETIWLLGEFWECGEVLV
jgi:hypothetical protein